MNTWAFRPCPWCASTNVAVESEQIVDRVVTGVDENNGPVYWAECQHCSARGPLVEWAADAIPEWNKRVPVTAEVSVDKILEQYSCDIVRIRSRLSDVKWADAGHHCESKSAVHAVIQMTKDIEQRIIPGLTAALKAQKGVGG